MSVDKRNLLPACVWLACAAFAWSQQPTAQPARQPTAQPARPGPASGQVELTHSKVYIHVDKTSIGQEHAVIGNLQSGALRFAAADNAQQDSGELVFDMTTFEADTLAARKYLGLSEAVDDATRQQVTATLRGKEVLHVRRFPTATLHVNKIIKIETLSARGLPQYEIQGDLTLHGRTRPVRFTADVEPVKGWLRVRGAFAILQSQFGIQPLQKMFGAIGVADRLEIYGDLLIAP